MSLGATEHQPITPHGDGDFITAAVVDPFGNVLRHLCLAQNAGNVFPGDYLSEPE